MLLLYLKRFSADPNYGNSSPVAGTKMIKVLNWF
jgi:hypothetical protein